MQNKPKKPRKPRKLTPKRERFCQEYVKDFNGTRAAIRTGFSANSAGQIAYNLLKDVQIKARIVELQNVAASEYNVTKQRLMSILMDIAGAELKDIIDPETGALMSVEKWPEHMRGVVSGMENDEIYAGGIPIGFKRKVKLWDKTKAIELLAKLCGFFAPDKITPVTPDGEAIIPVIKVYPVMPKNTDDV